MSSKTPIEVLIAEDEETDAFFIQQAFAQAKYKNHVHIVKDGEEVMNFLNKTSGYEDKPTPNMIFLDINMPRKDGHQTLIEIKASDKFKHIPVVIMSSSKAESDVRKSYSNFACAHIPKSNGLPEMLELVNSVDLFWFGKAILPKNDD